MTETVAGTTSADPLLPGARRMLTVTTLTWGTCFAAWTMFSILGIRIQSDLGIV